LHNIVSSADNAALTLARENRGTIGMMVNCVHYHAHDHGDWGDPGTMKVPQPLATQEHRRP
jgi:hypothetical protein